MICAYANSLTFSITVLLFKDVNTYILRKCIFCINTTALGLCVLEYHWLIYITMTPHSPAQANIIKTTACYYLLSSYLLSHCMIDLLLLHDRLILLQNFNHFREWQI